MKAAIFFLTGMLLGASAARADAPTALFLFGQTTDVRAFSVGGGPAPAGPLDVFSEPAALGWSVNPAVSVSRWPGFIPGTDYNFAGASMPVGSWLGLKVDYLGYGTGSETVEELDGSTRDVVLEQDNVYSLGLGARLTQWLFLGINAKAIDSSLGGTAHSQAYAGDADLLLRSLDDDTAMDLALLNSGSAMNYGAVPEALPQELRAGLSQRVRLGGHAVTASVGYGVLIQQAGTYRFSGGLAYGFGELFTLSAGFQQLGDLEQVTAGLGARLYGIDLAVGYGLALNQPGFGDSPLRFSLSYVFGPSSPLERGQAYMDRGERAKALALWHSVGEGDKDQAEAQARIARFTNPPRYTIKAEVVASKDGVLAQGGQGQLVVHVFNSGGESGHGVRLTASLKDQDFWLGPLFPKYAAIAAGDSAVFSATVRYFGKGKAMAVPLAFSIKDDLGVSMDQEINVIPASGGRVAQPSEADVAPEAEASTQSLEPVPQTALGRRPNGIAVVVGIEQYPNQMGDVTYATADAKMARAYAIGVMGIPESNVVMLTQGDATKGHILAALGRLKVRVPDADFLYFFYAGHGVPDPDNEAGGDPNLVPADGDLSAGAGDTLISLKDFGAKLRSTVKGPVVAMLDACFTGSREGRSVKSAEGHRGIIVRAKMNQPGITVLSAASGNGPSLPYEEAGQGLFTYWMLQGLKGPADADQDGVITAREALDYARAHVSKVSGEREVPELLGNGDAVLGYTR